MDRELHIGDTVIFIDEHRNQHQALVTKTWISTGYEPGCNLVFVVSDESKTDNYGRQIDRRTSLVHKNQQPAGGMCWAWPDEVA